MNAMQMHDSYRLALAFIKAQLDGDMRLSVEILNQFPDPTEVVKGIGTVCILAFSEMDNGKEVLERLISDAAIMRPNSG